MHHRINGRITTCEDQTVRFAWIDERPFNYLDGYVLTGSDVSLARAAFAPRSSVLGCPRDLR